MDEPPPGCCQAVAFCSNARGYASEDECDAHEETCELVEVCCSSIWCGRGGEDSGVECDAGTEDAGG